VLGSRPRHVQPLNVELPAAPASGDLIFDVTQADGTPLLLHYELQGGGSHERMPWRMLNYDSRLVIREWGDRTPISLPQLLSVVFYLGVGRGATDTGEYVIIGPDGKPSLYWRYRPIRLWQMEAAELLTLDQPAFLALIGLTRVREPEREMREAVKRIQQEVEDEEQSGQLLAVLVSLLTDQEAIKVIEKVLDPLDQYLLELPAQQRILRMGREEGLSEGIIKGREEGLAKGLAKGREEGRQEGLAKGREEGRQEGREEGQEEGKLMGLRNAIQSIVVERFNPPARDYLQVSRQLEGLTSGEALQRLLIAGVEAEDMATFTAHLMEELAGE
jgi:flagellar biosynthesis/type III secretory pathway protein FliH